MEERKSKKRKSEVFIVESKYTPDTIVVDDQHENHDNHETGENQLMYDDQEGNYDELIRFLLNQNEELIEILTDKAKSKKHPYKFILDSFQIAEHQQKIVDNPDFISYYDTQLTEVTTKEELDIVIENISNLKEIGIHCGNCSNFYHIKVGVLILRTVDKCYLIDLTKLRNSVTLLTQVFINPNIVKIFYDSDAIMKHLQQDLSLYFVNIFDINIARRILQMEELSIGEFLGQNYETYGKIPRDPMIYLKRPLPNFVKNYCKYLVNYHIHAYRNLKNQLLAEDQNLYYQILEQCNNKCKMVYQQSDKTEFLKIANRLKNYQNYQWRLLARFYKLRDELAKSNDKNPRQIILPFALINIISQNPADKVELCKLANSVYVDENVDQFFGIIKELREEMEIEAPPHIRGHKFKGSSNLQDQPIRASTSVTTTETDPLLLNSVNESLKRVADGLSTLMAGNNQVQDPSTSHHNQEEAEEEEEEDDGAQGEGYNDESSWQIDRQGDDYHSRNQESYNNNYQYNHRNNKRNRNNHPNNYIHNQRGGKKSRKNRSKFQDDNNRQNHYNNRQHNEKGRRKRR